MFSIRYYLASTLLRKLSSKTALHRLSWREKLNLFRLMLKLQNQKKLQPAPEMKNREREGEKIVKIFSESKWEPPFIDFIEM